MHAHTICLRCHQKCHLTVEVIDGKIVGVGEASPENSIAPCVEACPINMDVPGYLFAASQGKFAEAMAIMRDTNPFPLSCGRVCPHPCEDECIRGIIDEPIAIQWVKRMIADHALGNEARPTRCERTRKETIGIIGAGPAGLTAAHDLCKAGYGAVVYEAGPEAGGVLSRIIPDFKLPRQMVQADIDYIQALGVEIKTDTPVGEDGPVTIDQLLNTYDAVLIATGCWQPLSVEIPGMELEGVYHALPLMEEVKNNTGPDMAGTVVVIGGGNTAMDVARVAKRLGAEEVHIACLEERDAMPTYAREVEYAEREGAVLHPAMAPQRFVSDGGKRVSRVEFCRVASLNVNPEGRLTWSLQEGPESHVAMDADSVIIAIGQCPGLTCIGGACQPAITSRGVLAVDADTLATDIPHVYAAGDVVVGAGNLVRSIAAGHKAAAAIMAELGGGKTARERNGITDPMERARQRVNADFPSQRARLEMPMLSPSEAVTSFDEVERGFDEKLGMQEAGRCLNCSTVCIKGATLPDLMYHPDRLLYPLKRVGERGEGKWERISWDEALDTIAGNLKKIQDNYGPEAIHISCGSGQKHIGIQATKISEWLWPCPNTHLGRYTCIHPDVMSNSATFGDTITYEFGLDYANANLIVFWGSEPDVATPAQARVVHRALRRGAKLMVVDPRPIPMAKRADLWLRIRPGTDMALALAMQHVIIKEELYDKDFVEHYCAGFEQLVEHVKDYTPEWAAAITGLSVKEIVAAARLYATTRPGAIYIRLGSGAQQSTSTQTCRSIHILIGLMGNVDVKGGNLLYYRTFREHLFWQAYLQFWGIKPPAAVNDRRIGKEYPLMHKRAICNIPGTIRAMEEGRVRGLWCVADNLIVAEADNKRIWDIMQNKLDFIFVSDFFMTPTAELADIVLPAAFYPECDLLVAAFGYPSSYVTGARKVVEPLGECKDDREVAIEVAKRMGRDVSPWETVKDYFNWRLKYQGITYDELCLKPDSRIVFPRTYERFRDSSPPFSTASGKVELYSSVFEAMGVDPLPMFQEPPESPLSTPELFKEFPLIYTHYRQHCYMHSEGRQIKRQRQLIPEPYLEMNNETAHDLGIADGDWVSLETPRSAGKDTVRFKARLVEGMHPDVVAGPHGWWMPEKPRPEYGCFDSNINALLSLDAPCDPVVGVPQMRAILCRVKRADPH